MEKHIDSFDEYLRQGEPRAKERAESWKIAIGLQAVDGLTPSDYLVATAKRHIEGDITIDEVRHLIDTYYQTKTSHAPDDANKEEADKVSSNIAKFLNEKTFSFSPAGYLNVHRRIFDGVFKFAGIIRDCNITKREWVLHGDTVLYAGADEIRMALEHDISQERNFSYAGLNMGAMITHLARFVSNLWQIHAFREGNTRTTAVFTIKYLRFMGFEVTNDLFYDYSWYFRNSLVRANYRNIQKSIEPNAEYLERFFRNLLMGEQNELRNRYMLIHSETDIHPPSTPQVPRKIPVSLATDNPDIQELVKVIGVEKLSIREMLSALKLRDRKSFQDNRLKTAIANGFVCMLYPDRPKHPRQKYLLTVKGIALLQQIKSDTEAR